MNWNGNDVEPAKNQVFIRQIIPAEPGMMAAWHCDDTSTHMYTKRIFFWMLIEEYPLGEHANHIVQTVIPSATDPWNGITTDIAHMDELLGVYHKGDFCAEERLRVEWDRRRQTAIEKKAAHAD